MHRSSSLSAPAILLLLVTSGFGQSAVRTLPDDRLLDRYGLVRAWWNQATLNAQRDTVRHLTADEQMVYVQSTGGILTAFDADNGRRKWSIQLGFQDAPSFPAVSNDELVLVAASTRLYAIDKFNGGLVWNIILPGQPSTSPSMDAQHVYIGSLDGSVYALSLRKIRELYEAGLLPDWSAEVVVWRYATGEAISTPPVPMGPMVNFASLDRSLYSVTADERRLRFQLETDAAISAPLAHTDETVFLVSQDFKLYAINALTGRLRWEPYVSGLPIRKAPHVVGDEIYLLPQRGGIHAVNIADGKLHWWMQDVTGFVAASRRKVYASDARGNLLLISRANGALEGVLPLRQFSERFANSRTDRLYLSTSSGLVICLRERDLQFPIYHMFPKHRPILPDFAPEEAPAAAPGT
ncbi:MAG: PQQ-like beta-propeller repeat protein [Planctomycetes bacterium]|nr:PQQ-like beta-propeller repeat protein [Planctomycetota bacterium]